MAEGAVAADGGEGAAGGEGGVGSVGYEAVWWVVLVLFCLIRFFLVHCWFLLLLAVSSRIFGFVN